MRVPFLSAKDLLDDGTLNFSIIIKMISEMDFERLSLKSQPRKGDIIYSLIGACLGKARIVESDVRFLVSYSFCLIRMDFSWALARYFRFVLDGEMILTEAKMRTQGIGVPDLGLREIGRFPIPLPPLPEQRAICDYLDRVTSRIDGLIRMNTDQITKLREYRQVLISAAVTGNVAVPQEVAT